MRPGVIRRKSDSSSSPFLEAQYESVIAGSRAVVHLIHGPKQPAGSRVFQTQDAPEILIGGCRTRAGGIEAELSRNAVAGNVDCVISLRQAPQMRSMGSEIAGRNQPVHADLFLNAEIP